MSYSRPRKVRLTTWLCAGVAGKHDHADDVDTYNTGQYSEVEHQGRDL